MTQELKPCPFCGGAGRMHESERPQNGREYFVTCSACKGNCAKRSSNKEDAAIEWNRRPDLAAAAPSISDTANCATCGAVGTVTSTKARCTLCGMFADTAEPTLKDHARRFVADFSRDVGFVMSDAQQEIMLNLFLKHAASARVTADTAGAIRGPLTEHQRQNAIVLYMNLPHSWESAIAVVSDASRSGYKNGVLDASPAIDAAPVSEQTLRTLVYQIEDLKPSKHKDNVESAIAILRNAFRLAIDAAGAKPVAWQYENQHGNPFLTHKDPDTWHPHDRGGFKNFVPLSLPLLSTQRGRVIGRIAFMMPHWITGPQLRPVKPFAHTRS